MGPRGARGTIVRLFLLFSRLLLLVGGCGSSNGGMQGAGSSFLSMVWPRAVRVVRAGVTVVVFALISVISSPVAHLYRAGLVCPGRGKLSDTLRRADIMLLKKTCKRSLC
jgi:hypothetical protein